MEQNEFNDIDQLFKNGLENSRVTPPSGIWEGVAAHVAGSTAGAVGTGIFIKLILGVAVAAGISTAAYFYATDTVETNPPKQELPVAAKESPVVSAAEQPVALPVQPTDKKEQAISPMAPPMDPEINPDYPIEWMEQMDGVEDMPDMQRSEGSENIENTLSDPISNTNECIHDVRIISNKVTENEYSFQMDGKPGATAAWYVNNVFVKQGATMTYVFPSEKEGKYSVKLKVFKPLNCVDSALESINITVQKTGRLVLMPDYLTPNGDGVNDDYWINIENPLAFELIILNEQGKQVFRSDSPDKRWNGYCGSIQCPAGKYIAVLSYRFAGDKEKSVKRRTVLLTRE